MNIPFEWPARPLAYISIKEFINTMCPLCRAAWLFSSRRLFVTCSPDSGQRLQSLNWAAILTFRGEKKLQSVLLLQRNGGRLINVRKMGISTWINEPFFAFSVISRLLIDCALTKWSVVYRKIALSFLFYFEILSLNLKFCRDPSKLTLYHRDTARVTVYLTHCSSLINNLQYM